LSILTIKLGSFEGLLKIPLFGADPLRLSQTVRNSNQGERVESEMQCYVKFQ